MGGLAGGEVGGHRVGVQQDGQPADAAPREVGTTKNSIAYMSLKVGKSPRVIDALPNTT